MLSEFLETEINVEISEQFCIDCDKKIENVQTKIFDLLSTQSLSMKEISDLNDDVTHSMDFDCSTNRVPLKIAKIKGDGNCIFSAMAHQSKIRY